MLPKVLSDYPNIFDRLRNLEDSVAETTRVSSLLVAGQRLGASVFEREHGPNGGLELFEAIERIGVP